MQAILANYLQINNKIKNYKGMYVSSFFYFELFYILINIYWNVIENLNKWEINY